MAAYKIPKAIHLIDEIPLTAVGKIDKKAERRKALKSAGPEGPIFMVNLLKFKDKAEYEDGRETDLTDPNRATLVEMMKSLRMAEIAVHRKAGLKGQLNIETVNPGGREE